MNIMLIGDICGRPGRQTAAHFIPKMKEQYNIDFIIANGENSAGGVGITASVFDELLAMGIDVVTTGNHIWDKKEIFDFIDGANRLIRPANYPPGTPGVGFYIAQSKGQNVGIVNLAGRVFMPPIDCPFRAVDSILEQICEKCDIMIVDFHAETTSEKLAMGWYLDGRVSCVVGTHTHVQTADERILPKGTAYITDLGMVGPRDGVLGVSKEPVLKKFLTGLPVRFSVANGSTLFCALIFEVDESSGETKNIIRIQQYLD